jgi:ABC-2 type transport system ATP-binding protein
MSQTASSPAIELQSLSKTYTRQNGKNVTAVNDLNLTVEAGQVFGFLGPNGAGKTTTIKMICGLVLPTAGRICLNGYDVSRQHRQALTQIGAVLEGARNVYWRLTAWQNLLYFARLKGAGQNFKHRAEQLLRELELWERRNDEVRLFSRGMQQKVAIACALVNDPPILLLDEPTLGLDVQAARTVKTWIQELAGERGKTIVLTTHQLDMAQDVCQQIAIINHGRLVANQPVWQLLQLFRQEYYQIRINGLLTGPQSRLFDGLTVTQNENETLISGAISNEEVYSLLAQAHETGLTLTSVNRIEPDLEEIFMNLVETG